MKPNPNKYNLHLHSDNKQEIKIAEEIIMRSQYKKLPGVTIDQNFSFNINVIDL